MVDLEYVNTKNSINKLTFEKTDNPETLAILSTIHRTNEYNHNKHHNTRGKLKR